MINHYTKTKATSAVGERGMFRNLELVHLAVKLWLYEVITHYVGLSIDNTPFQVFTISKCEPIIKCQVVCLLKAKRINTRVFWVPILGVHYFQWCAQLAI